MHRFPRIVSSERNKKVAKSKETCIRFDFGCGESLSLMSPYAQLTIRNKAFAVTLAKEGYSTDVTAKKISCNQSTVSRALQLERETGDAQRRAGSGRKNVRIQKVSGSIFEKDVSQ